MYSSYGSSPPTPTPPVISAQPRDTIIVVGNTATLNVSAWGYPSPNFHWQWRNGTSWTNIGGNSTTLSIPNASLNMSGRVFRVVVTNNAGQAVSNNVTLTVAQVPVITRHPHSQSTSLGNIVDFFADATGIPSPALQWQVRSGNNAHWFNVSTLNISGTTTPHLRIWNAAQGFDNLQFRMLATNIGGATASGTATLTVRHAPVVLINPRSTMMLRGHPAWFNAGASGNPAPNYQWEFLFVWATGETIWVPIAGATGMGLSVAADDTNNGRSFRARIWNSEGEVFSTPAVLFVTESIFQVLPPVIIQHPVSPGPVQAGSVVTLTSDSRANPMSEVHWQCRNVGSGNWVDVFDSNITGERTTTLVFENATPELNNMEYRMFARNHHGSAVSQPARVVVEGVQVPPSPEAHFIPRFTTIDSRSTKLNDGYGTAAPTNVERDFDNIDRIILHHTGGNTQQPRDRDYHFTVGSDGEVFYERLINWRAPHTNREQNERSIGISCVGNFTNFIPPEQGAESNPTDFNVRPNQLRSLIHLLADCMIQVTTIERRNIMHHAPSRPRDFDTDNRGNVTGGTPRGRPQGTPLPGTESGIAGHMNFAPIDCPGARMGINAQGQQTFTFGFIQDAIDLANIHDAVQRLVSAGRVPVTTNGTPTAVHMGRVWLDNRTKPWANSLRLFLLNAGTFWIPQTAIQYASNNTPIGERYPVNFLFEMGHQVGVVPSAIDAMALCSADNQDVNNFAREFMRWFGCLRTFTAAQILQTINLSEGPINIQASPLYWATQAPQFDNAGNVERLLVNMAAFIPFEPFRSSHVPSFNEALTHLRNRGITTPVEFSSLLANSHRVNYLINLIIEISRWIRR